MGESEPQQDCPLDEEGVEERREDDDETGDERDSSPTFSPERVTDTSLPSLYSGMKILVDRLPSSGEASAGSGRKETARPLSASG
ncbi:hypothetical protein [Halomarina ordinaria]|uniref:Uncharacterized protein n=1 Tax=Halomarina ordinaria TaxID=3033939 RepID=A0ABD5U4U3_9EURY|nr:hypothetical protein [Halomarina sp. PSRA2]